MADTMNPVVVTPGIKTTEFWLSLLAIVLGCVLASGKIVEGSMAAQIIGGVLAILGQLGYAAGRSQIKVQALKTTAMIAGDAPDLPGKV